MRNLIYTTILAAVCLTNISAVADTNLIVNDQNGNSVIEGKITDIVFDDVTLALSNGSEVSVDIDDLGLDEGRFDEYFPKGSYVKIIGHFSNDEFEAESIVMDSDSNIIVNP